MIFNGKDVAKTVTMIFNGKDVANPLLWFLTEKM